MRLAAALCCCLLLAVPTAHGQHFWKYANLDAPSILSVNSVLRDMPGASLAQLQAACAAAPACLAFSSKGVLRSYVNTTSGTQGTDLYVKHAQPQPETGLPWPLPLNVSRGSSTLCLGAGFHFSATGAPTDVVATAFTRYRALILGGHTTGSCSACYPERTELKQLSVTGGYGSAVDLQLGVDESYTLTISAGGVATLSAPTEVGVLRGLETFSQLVGLDAEGDGSTLVLQHAPWAITDTPRFPWRGLMLDTARHWFPVSAIERTLEAMSSAKLNTFHWHITDWNAFPMQSQAFPTLWRGAFSAYERYTTADMAQVVAFGRARGIRVVLELDVPAHAGSWCAGLPEVCGWKDCPIDLQLLNPAANLTLPVLTALAAEAAAVFSDSVMHWGGDEVINNWSGVAHGCWSKDPQIQAWMKTQKIENDLGIYLYFAKQLASITAASGKRTPMHWHDLWAAAKKAGAKVGHHIVQNWGGPSITTGATADGLPVVVSSGFYLDNDKPWTAMYAIDPAAGITDPQQLKLVLGGEAALWSESMDASNLDSRAWPRAAAIAERLWSEAASTVDVIGARARLEEFRCLLVRRGVAAGTVSGTAVTDLGPCGLEHV